MFSQAHYNIIFNYTILWFIFFFIYSIFIINFITIRLCPSMDSLIKNFLQWQALWFWYTFRDYICPVSRLHFIFFSEIGLIFFCLGFCFIVCLVCKVGQQVLLFWLLICLCMYQVATITKDFSFFHLKFRQKLYVPITRDTCHKLSHTCVSLTPFSLD